MTILLDLGPLGDSILVPNQIHCDEHTYGIGFPCVLHSEIYPYLLFTCTICSFSHTILHFFIVTKPKGVTYHPDTLIAPRIPKLQLHCYDYLILV